MRSGRSFATAASASPPFSASSFLVRAGEQIAQDAMIVLLILDHQNALCHAGLVCCSTVTGSVNEKFEP
jgi:hypothetical protein